MDTRLAFLLAAACIGMAQAARAINCPAVTRVGISDLGYSAYQDDGGYHGTAVDLVAELGRRTGCRFRIEWFPRGRLFAEFYKGKVDIAMASLRNAERDHYASWIPYTYTQFDLLLTRQNAGSYASLADFVDRGTGRLNVIRGVASTPAAAAQLERLEKLGRVEYVSDYGVVFKKILAGRAEGTLAPPVIHLMYLHRLGIEDRIKTMPIAEWPRIVIGAYASNASLSGEVRKAYAGAFYAMVSDGTVLKIYERYLGPEMARAVFAGGVREILDAYPR